MSFWDFIWFLFWTYVFVAYLMVMFQIITDLFRDHDLGGGREGSLVHRLDLLSDRRRADLPDRSGKQMGERQMQRARRAQGETEQYIQTVAGRSPADEISSAKKLLDAGTITQAEFDRSRSRPWPDRGPPRTRGRRRLVCV